MGVSNSTQATGNRIDILGDGELACVVRAQQGLTGAVAGPVVVIDFADDARSLAALDEVLGSGHAHDLPAVVAQISDRRLRRAVQARIDQQTWALRPVVVDAASLVAEHFAATTALFERAFWRNQPRLHVALVGFSAVGRAMLDALLAAGIAGDLAPPMFHILTEDVVEARHFIQREMPEIGASAEIVVSQFTVGQLQDETCNPLLEAETRAPLTAVLILLDDPLDTLWASAAIVELQDRHGRCNAAVFVGGPGSEQACNLVTPARSSSNFARSISQVAPLEAIARLLGFILDSRDVLPRRLHEAYLSRYAGKTAAGTAWTDLSETFRRANRRAAAHLPQKLWSLGFTPPDDPTFSGIVEPSAYRNVIEPLVRSTIEDHTVRRLARLEHERWCADRRLDGWSHGEVRDDSRRRHPSLVPFDDPRLTADEIDKDVAQVRFILDTLVRPGGGGPRTRFVVGIAPEALGGISVGALSEQIAASPERWPTLISPLLTTVQFETTAFLLQGLTKAGRDFQLIVPEWYPANQMIRDAAVAELPQLHAMLADRSTWIAPIGPTGLLRSDAWEDAFDVESARAALTDYVSRRAQAFAARD